MRAPTLQDPDQLSRILALALANTVNGVVITDAKQPGNPIVHVNEGFTRITGYGAEEVLGRNCNFLQGEERGQAEVTQLRRAIEAQEPVTVVIRNFRKDGTPFWNQVELSPVHDTETGELTHFFALQTDVTLKRQAERANVLRALELERMFRGGPMGMILLDEAGCATLVTPATWRLLGVAPQRIEGLDAKVMAHRMAAALGRPEGSLPWPSGSQHVRWELPAQATQAQPEAQARVLDVSCFDLGTLTREQIIVLRDTTQEEVENLTRSQFLATAAHELRTPMGSICGFTELLLMRTYSPEQARPLLETILRQAMRLNAMLNDLLDLSQMDTMGSQSFKLVPVPLTEALRKAAEAVIKPGSERRIDLQLPDADVAVLGHAHKLEQVLINLLSNAIKYSPEGGPVTLGASIDRTAGQACIAVSDSGMGLSPEHQARLFTRFFRANPSGPIPGTGLGLVIVKELVERMGGRIDVNSELGRGSTFTVSLNIAGATP